MLGNILEEQSDFFNIINKELYSNKISHAFLIESNNYYQTNVLVKELCKMIINSDDQKINSLIDNNDYPDIKYIYPDGDYIKKGQLLDIIDDFSETSIIGHKKIYIIEQADKLNDSSANTILKFLEEPVSGVYAILVCNSRYNVINTILSRCQIFYLKDIRSINNDCDCLSEDISKIVDLLLLGSDAFIYYSDLQLIFKDKKVSVDILNRLVEFFYNVYKGYIDLKCTIDKVNILSIIFILEDFIGRLNYNLNFKLFLDRLIIDVSEVL